jgi:hypothetical protein
MTAYGPRLDVSTSDVRYETGSQEAIAACEARQQQAIANAHAELDREDGGREPLNADDFEDTRDYDVNSEGDEQ